MSDIAARIDRLPASRFVGRMVTRISLSAIFEAYDIFMIAYIAVGLIKGGIFVPTTPSFFDVTGIASFIGSGFAGMFFGTLIFTWVSDMFGRRTTLAISVVWYSIATAIMAFGQSPAEIDLWRFVAGLGIGVQLITVDAYISELVPAASRGRNIALLFVIANLSVPLAAAFAMLFVPNAYFGLDGWRIVVLIGSTGLVLIWPLLHGLLESPRWLAARGRNDEAETAMKTIEQGVARESQKPLPAPAPVRRSAASGSARWSDIWSGKYAGRTLLLSLFNLCNTVGFYGFAAWVPTLLTSEGITVPKTLQYVFIMALMNPLGPLFAMKFADRVERKWQITALSILIAACGILWSFQRDAVGIICFGALVTIGLNWFVAAFHAYQAELFPTRIRARAVGFVYCWSRFSAIFVGFVIAMILRGYGTLGVFSLIAAAMLIIAVIIGVFGPLTNGRRLEELSE